MKRQLTPIQRFWNKVVLNPNGCWDWKGALAPNGYGQFKVNGIQMGAHRFSWTYFESPIPIGLSVCHRCDRRNCVNPDHLFTGTNQDNQVDCVEKGRHKFASKKFCIKGHEFTPRNTHSYVNFNGRIARQCRACLKIRNDARVFLNRKYVGTRYERASIKK